MVRLGLHVSVAGGIDRAVSRAREKGCDVFQIFSSNPRKWCSNPIPCELAKRFIALQREFGPSLAVDHMPYLPNLASANDEVYAKSVQSLAKELGRCQALGIAYLVTHMGSHNGAGRKRGLDRIVEALQTVFSECESDTILLLENSAGTKNSMGSTFSDIAAVLESLSANHHRLGVCLDTCHLHAAGYDLRNPRALQATLDQFEDCIGLEQLMLLHLNDCKGGIGSHLDRHEHIGLGQIGVDGLCAILCHPILADLAMILETPVDARRDDSGNLEVARRLAQG
ncbi:MAG: deoxyribonuclease IV [Methanothrix sp.]|nr:deoxyribonuclease IV [Methanothrix sp.]MDD4446557.1 deoxyribonuclease IV [Methanothrix sp.]